MSDQLIADMNTIIPEESSIEAVDGELANNNGPALKTEDPRERNDRQKVAQYFRFVETVEETKLVDKQRANQNKPSFIKDYDGKQSNWTDNHFFFEDGNESDKFKVLFTSYQVQKVIDNGSRAGLSPENIPIELNKQDGKTSCFYYMNANKPRNVVPVPNIPREGLVCKYMEQVKKEFPQCFKKDCSLEDVLERMSDEDIRESENKLKEQHEKELRNFRKENKCEVEGNKKHDQVTSFAKKYREGLMHQDLMKICKAMYDFQADLDERDHEIRLGLGHIRMIYSKNNSEARKILNAPLIEVPVKIDHDSLKVVPVKGGRLKWNGEAKNALLHTGAKSKNKRILAEFLAMLGNGDPTKILLGDPKTFLKYVEAASQFRFFSIVKNPTDPDLHQFPEGVEDKLVLTTEWCLFVRPKRSNSISNDALAFSNAFEETSLDLSLPCRSLLLGSSASHCKNDAFGNSNFDLPLPASQNQLEIIKHVFSENNFVTLIRGPPG